MAEEQLVNRALEVITERERLYERLIEYEPITIQLLADRIRGVLIAAGVYEGIPIFSQDYIGNIIPPAAPGGDQGNDGDENVEIEHDGDADAPVDAGMDENNNDGDADAPVDVGLEFPAVIYLQDFTRFLPALTQGHSRRVKALLRAYHNLCCEGHILRFKILNIKY